MRKLFFAFLVAVLSFVLLNFLFWNVTRESFNHPITFRFVIPHLMTLESSEIPLGFVVILAFCSGILFFALLQIIPVFFRSFLLRAREKQIRGLEGEVEKLRETNEDLQKKMARLSDDRMDDF